ncbi:MAG: hypothetical protein NT137_03705 [Methanomassiliicoccales archaeon]|nr:hypothetical protein [Methanomassiliicoccales archaeon]
METTQFNKEEVLSVLVEAGKICSKNISVYLVGGGAMAIRGEKDATKDVDLILESEEHAEELNKALTRLGFEVSIRPPVECKSLVDARILTISRGMRIDIFVGTICDKLIFSQGMKKRSEFYSDLSQISLSLCSREDIFLLKSVTERNRDLDDMIVLYRKGIDKETLLTECRFQSQHDDLIGGRIWEVFLLIKIEEMEKKYGISIPWKRELSKIAEVKLGSKLVLEQIKGGLNTVPKISNGLKMKPAQVRQYLSNLEKAGIIVIDKTVKPNKVNLNEP